MQWFDNLMPFQEALAESPGSMVNSPDFDEKLPFVETGGYTQDYTDLTTVVELGELVRPIGKAELYRIGGFIDGIQRTLLVKYVNQLPLHFHMSTAVMMNEKRDVAAGPIWDFSFLYPHPDILPKVFKNVKVVSTTRGEGTSINRDFHSLVHKAHRIAYNIRRNLEREILREALKDGGISGTASKIILDGTIDRREPFITSNALIGVVKRHFAHYFPPEDAKEIFAMPSDYRSSDFLIATHKGKRVLQINSFYLRLRHKSGDPTFGLVRIEHHRSLNPDRVAQTVNKYALPVTDTPSWDRKLFSIFECELFLDAYLPSLEVLKGVFQIY